MNRGVKKVFIVTSAVWALVSLVPYVVIGEYWGMVWYLFNLPLAELLKGSLWGHSPIAYVVLVTIINAIIVSSVISSVWMLLASIRKARKAKL
ncbi:MAG: hypothetical protein EOP88_05555 [Verrucomicrobiaceae bacterium]|nr:MAG: hypothetical protein EOP88_05555 [Verrucomicrobiaceae bacterium]